MLLKDGVQLLTTQESIDRLGWQKESLPVSESGDWQGGRYLSKGPLPASGNQWDKSFIDRSGEWLHAENAQSSPTSGEEAATDGGGTARDLELEVELKDMTELVHSQGKT